MRVLPIRVFIGLLFGLLMINTVIASAAIGPEALIKQTTAEVLKQIKANSAEYQNHPEQLYALVDEVVLPHFDFAAMTDLALGRYKDKVNAKQKAQIVKEFRTLLVRTYGKALLEYNDQVLTYLPITGSEVDGKVTVRTQIEQPSGFPIPLNYRFKHDGQDWKVYDITVDDISLVTNYRSGFARQIRKKGIDGLIELLRNRNADQSG